MHTWWFFSLLFSVILLATPVFFLFGESLWSQAIKAPLPRYCTCLIILPSSIELALPWLYRSIIFSLFSLTYWCLLRYGNPLDALLSEFRTHGPDFAGYSAYHQGTAKLRLMNGFMDLSYSSRFTTKSAVAKKQTYKTHHKKTGERRKQEI